MIGDGIQYILKISSRTDLAMLIAIEACIYLASFLYSFCKKKTNWCINTIVLLYIAYYLYGRGLHHVLNNAMLNYIGGFAMCLIFDYWLRKKYSDFLKVLNLILVALILLNFVTILVFPQGMYETALYKAN